MMTKAQIGKAASEMNNLNLLVIGAGAIGTYIGGSLALGGNRAVFLERPEIAGQLRERGLRLALMDGQHHITAPQIAANIEDALALGPFDAALFAVKSYHTGRAIAPFKPFASQLPPFICLQNGVDNEPALARHLGDGKVIAGTITSAVGKPGLGEIVLERLRGVGIANNPAHPSLVTRIVRAMSAAGLNARLYPRAADMKWSKLLTNLIANPTSAILDMTPAEVFAHPGLYRLEIAQLREALGVMDALGARVVNLPGTPVKALAFAARYLPPSVSRPLLARAIGKGRGEKMPSFHIDLHGGGKYSEVGYLHGAVAAHGERVGTAAPVNRFLTETMLGLVQGDIPLDVFRRQPEKLLMRM
ncbi:MAG: ketopantoate reductase family protein [Anaerolineales bacterium]